MRDRARSTAPAPRPLPAALLCALALRAAAAGNLCTNGTFDSAEGPLAGWTVDYRWMGNSHYMNNQAQVSAVEREDGLRGVLRIAAAGDAGAMVECRPIAFDADSRYTCTLRVKGGPYRLYFAGHKWQPGIRPHDDPAPGELRRIYKSKACTGSSDAWRTVTFELPGVELSAAASRYLREVRFVTVYIWTTGTVYVDNVEVKRRRDPAPPRQDGHEHTGAH